ncbi:hypothetical protein H6504_02695 [Candidatus Woesearchaeota archaeon]|nr:hypothetical protein [Candidatus Woesearchaeota archaeon]
MRPWLLLFLLLLPSVFGASEEEISALDDAVFDWDVSKLQEIMQTNPQLIYDYHGDIIDDMLRDSTLRETVVDMYVEDPQRLIGDTASVRELKTSELTEIIYENTDDYEAIYTEMGLTQQDDFFNEVNSDFASGQVSQEMEQAMLKHLDDMAEFEFLRVVDGEQRMHIRESFLASKGIDVEVDSTIEAYDGTELQICSAFCDAFRTDLHVRARMSMEDIELVRAETGERFTMTPLGLRVPDGTVVMGDVSVERGEGLDYKVGELQGVYPSVDLRGTAYGTSNRYSVDKGTLFFTQGIVTDSGLVVASVKEEITFAGNIRMGRLDSDDILLCDGVCGLSSSPDGLFWRSGSLKVVNNLGEYTVDSDEFSHVELCVAPPCASSSYIGLRSFGEEAILEIKADGLEIVSSTEAYHLLKPGADIVIKDIEGEGFGVGELRIADGHVQEVGPYSREISLFQELEDGSLSVITKTHCEFNEVLAGACTAKDLSAFTQDYSFAIVGGAEKQGVLSGVIQMNGQQALRGYPSAPFEDDVLVVNLPDGEGGIQKVVVYEGGLSVDGEPVELSAFSESNQAVLSAVLANEVRQTQLPVSDSEIVEVVSRISGDDVFVSVPCEEHTCVTKGKLKNDLFYVGDVPILDFDDLPNGYALYSEDSLNLQEGVQLVSSSMFWSIEEEPNTLVVVKKGDLDTSGWEYVESKTKYKGDTAYVTQIFKDGNKHYAIDVSGGVYNYNPKNGLAYGARQGVVSIEESVAALPEEEVVIVPAETTLAVKSSTVAITSEEDAQKLINRYLVKDGSLVSWDEAAKNAKAEGYDLNQLVSIRDLFNPEIGQEAVKSIPVYLEESAGSQPEGESLSLGPCTNEGSLCGNRAIRNNNPGNLRYSSRQIDTEGGFSVFATPAEGWQALVGDLNAKLSGNSQAMKNKYGDYNPETTSLLQLISVYAPSEDSNNPAKYANYISRNTGYSAETKLSTIDVYLLAEYMAKYEGWEGPSIQIALGQRLAQNVGG